MKNKASSAKIDLANKMIEEMEAKRIGTSPAVGLRQSLAVFSKYVSDDPYLLDLLTTPSQLSQIKVNDEFIFSAIFLTLGQNHLEHLEGYLHALAGEDLVSASAAVLTPTLMNSNVRKKYINFLQDWAEGSSGDNAVVEKRKNIVWLEIEQRLDQVISYHIHSGIDPAKVAREIVSELCLAMGGTPVLLVKNTLSHALPNSGEASGERGFLISERASDVIHAALELGLDVNDPSFVRVEENNPPIFEDLFSLVLRHRQEVGVPVEWTGDPILFLLIDEGAQWRDVLDDPEICPKVHSLLSRHPQVRRELLMKIPSDAPRPPLRRGKLG